MFSVKHAGLRARNPTADSTSGCAAADVPLTHGATAGSLHAH